MTCPNCKAENAPLKKCCYRCGAVLSGYTINNVTGEYGYRNPDGSFTPIKHTTMDEKLNDICWQCLPKEAREEIKEEYALNAHLCSSSNERVRIIGDSQNRQLDEIFGHHNLTSDTEPEEMLYAPKWRVEQYLKGLDVCIDISDLEQVKALRTALGILFGDKCLPDKIQDTGFGGMSLTPPAYKLDVKPKPKFKIGDKVRIIIEGWQRDPISEVISYDEGDNTYKLDALDCEEGGLWVKEWQIEPYTEPEHRNLSQETANCDNSEDNQLKDNMEEKELNLGELLKGCVGEWFYVTPCGEMELKEINKLELKSLHFSRDAINCLTKTDGKAYENGSCIIYPSRALYEKYPLDAKKAWEVWASDRKPTRWTPQIGERIFWVNANLTVSQDRFNDFETQRKRRAVGNEFKTGKEAEQAAEVIKEALQKFHEQNNEKNNTL